MSGCIDGPYKVGNAGDPLLRWLNIVTDDDDEVMVADVIDFGRDPQRELATANLLAASWDLWEACKCAVAQLEADHDPAVAAEMFGGEPDPARAQNINRHDVAEMVRAALAKAGSGA